ncbi:MAG: hypothetical protein RLZZ227_26 [Pseudomonadota bacterium]|jgi:DNA-binding winged helix-turn-helix (wHTH) protein/TolB-like protein
MRAPDAVSEYRFSSHRLDARQRKLFNPAGEAISLSSRAFDTLLVLLAHHGETLSKSRIMQTVWPNAVVEENNLNQAISTLRKALGDTKSENNFILTVPGRGYCFVAPVEVLSWPQPGPAAAPEALADEQGAVEPRPLRPPANQANFPYRTTLALAFAVLAAGVILVLPTDDVAAPPAAIVVAAPAASVAWPPADSASIRNSIAVMPFTMLAPDGAEKDIFAIGLHDEVINQLTKIRALQVIGRDSVLALADDGLPMAELARVLRVEAVMSGTIMIVDDHARISLQLLDAMTGVTLWANTYEADKGDLSEMISIQSDIAVHVASALEAEIGQAEQETIAAIPTRSLQAYRFNLAAKYAHVQQDFAKEWDLSRQALALDPDYYDAFFTFSSVNTVMVATPLPGMTSRKHFELALDSAERMIQIAPERSAGYALKAVALGTAKDWAGVSAAVDKLSAMGAPLSDQHYISLLLMCMGDFRKAIEIYEANLITEPVNFFSRAFMLAALELDGKREQARAEYEVGQELSPVWWGDTVNIFLALGRNEPLQDVDQLIGVSPGLRAVLMQWNDAEKVAAGLQAFRASPAKVSAEAIYYAALAAHIGDDEAAVEFLRVGTEDVWTSLFWLWLPVFDETRQLDSFRQLLRDSGIVDYWREHGWPEVCQPAGASFTCEWTAYPVLAAQ